MKKVNYPIEKNSRFSTLYHSIPLCCPLCKGHISHEKNAFHCSPCKKKYPVISGVPDMRVFGDPYLGFENDYKRTQLVLDNMGRFDFHGLLKFYWSNSPETPDDLREKFVRTVLIGQAKGKQVIKELESYQNPEEEPKDVLEIGCGTGGFLLAASQKYKNVIGADIALRWLIVAKKRFEEAGVEIPLICCCAEHLPFPDHMFDLVVANSTLEHTKNQEHVISESNRTLRADGKMFIATPNRFSLTVEPHVYLWGVGFLPRSWMQSYVKFLKGVDYKNYRLLSVFELKKLLKKTFRNVIFLFPDIDNTSLSYFSNWKKLQVGIYRWIRQTTLGELFLLFLGPMYYILCQKKNK